MARVLSVGSVQLSLQKSNPPTILVVADGIVGTPGWKNIDLVPIEHPVSADGILDLEFVGTPPEGIVIQVTRPVTGDFVITENVEKIVGVVVHARTNSVTQLLSGPSTAVPTQPPLNFGVTPPLGGTPGTADMARMTAFGLNASPHLTTLAVGEEGITTFASQFAESPPLTPHIEKMAARMAETMAMIPSESWVQAPAEKLALGTAEKFMLETSPVTDFVHNQKFASAGENGPGPDPIGPMFFSPFGVR